MIQAASYIMKLLIFINSIKFLPKITFLIKTSFLIFQEKIMFFLNLAKWRIPQMWYTRSLRTELSEFGDFHDFKKLHFRAQKMRIFGVSKIYIFSEIQRKNRIYKIFWKHRGRIDLALLKNSKFSFFLAVFHFRSNFKSDSSEIHTRAVQMGRTLKCSFLYKIRNFWYLLRLVARGWSHSLEVQNIEKSVIFIFSLFATGIIEGFFYFSWWLLGENKNLRKKVLRLMVPFWWP